jgi:tetratricopeptide (TPR) repeat protein
MRFKEATCRGSLELLEGLRTKNPRWLDTLVFEGRRELAREPAVVDVLKASELFARAHAEFPESDAITLTYANAQSSIGEYQSALELFDKVLQDEPTHRDALVGRMMNLSYLDKHLDAISVATRMIELGTWHIGDAYYWRAWNRYHHQELETAWADVEEGTRLLVTTSVYTLAGFIAFARKELDTAIQRFDRAFTLDRTNCEAVWTGAMVHVAQQAWVSAAPKFVAAAGCFSWTAAEARTDVQRVQAATYAEALKTRRIEAAQKRLETAEHRRAQSAFNAAQSFLRIGQKAEALIQLETAAEHPLMRDKAASLKASLGKVP